MAGFNVSVEITSTTPEVFFTSDIVTELFSPRLDFVMLTEDVVLALEDIVALVDSSSVVLPALAELGASFLLPVFDGSDLLVRLFDAEESFPTFFISLLPGV